jgi:hypothetical protein
MAGYPRNHYHKAAQVSYADGSTVEAGQGGGSGVTLRATYHASSAVLLGLGRHVLVAAPGANKFIRLISVIGIFKYGTVTYTTDDAWPTIGYGDVASPFAATAENFVSVGGIEDAIYDLAVGTNGTLPLPPTEVVNKALVLMGVGTLADGDGTLDVSAIYTIEDY